MGLFAKIRRSVLKTSGAPSAAHPVTTMPNATTNAPAINNSPAPAPPSKRLSFYAHDVDSPAAAKADFKDDTRRRRSQDGADLSSSPHFSPPYPVNQASCSTTSSRTAASLLAKLRISTKRLHRRNKSRSTSSTTSTASTTSTSSTLSSLSSATTIDSDKEFAWSVSPRMSTPVSPAFMPNGAMVESPTSITSQSSFFDDGVPIFSAPTQSSFASSASTAVSSSAAAQSAKSIIVGGSVGDWFKTSSFGEWT